MIEELYNTCYRELVDWCGAMTGSPSRAEDLVQEAFVRAIANEALLATFAPRQRRAWLYRTVKNLFIDRKRHAAFETVTDELPERPRREDAYDALDSRQLLQVLPEDERLLFTMRYLQGYNSTELGRIFNIPPGTVRAKLSSARKHLREALKT